MNSLAVKRTEVIARGVSEGVGICQNIIDALKEGVRQISEDDEIEMENLKDDVMSLKAEIDKLVNMNIAELSSKVEEYTVLQRAAERLLNNFKVRLKRRDAISNQDVIVPPQSTIYSRLPELEMPKFDGDVLKWKPFWDQFHSSVHIRPNLQEVDKLQYLQNALEGDAKRVTARLEMTSQNYQVAIDRLKNRYGNHEHIITAHYLALENITPATSDVKDCRRVLDEIESHIEVLKTLGEDTNHKRLKISVLGKFPQDVIYDLRLKSKGGRDDFSVDSLRTYLDDIISAREMSAQLSGLKGSALSTEQRFTTEALYSQPTTQTRDRLSTTTSKPEDLKPHSLTTQSTCDEGNRSKKQTSDENTLSQSKPTNSENRRKRPSPKSPGEESTNRERPSKRNHRACFFCGEDHYSDDCSKYPSFEERSKLVNEQRRCIVCCRAGHKPQDCRNRRSCFHCKSFGQHHSSLCPNPRIKFEKQTNVLFSNLNTETVLQTVAVDVPTKSGQSMRCRILFDTGSERSYVNSDTARDLQTNDWEDAKLTIFTFGTKTPLTRNTKLISFTLPTDFDPVGVSAFLSPTTTGTIPTFTDVKRTIQNSLPHLKLAGDVEHDGPADIIIGNDYYYSFILGKIVKIDHNLYLLDSKFGWVLSGCLPDRHRPPGDSLSFLTYVHSSQHKKTGFTTPDPAICDDNIKDLWELETIGIRDSPKALLDEEAVKYFNETTSFINNRYYVKWPWASFPPELPINFGLALGRLKSLVGRLDSTTIHQYDSVLKDQLDKGVVEIIHESRFPQSHPVHYLPHHCVIQENKTTKLRIVYDASAKVKGHNSLNELLYKGPLMLEELTSILLRFRSYEFGVIADIEKAFLQVGLQAPDRDVTRFLWLKDVDKIPTDDNLVHYRFCRVPFGVISSPFLLAATINFHLQRTDSPILTQLSRSLYVDNLVTGAKSHSELLKLYSEARSSFEELSMNLREWTSNDQFFRDSVPHAQRNKAQVVSVLGLTWDTQSDRLSLSLKLTTIQKTVRTKRDSLRVIASVFDPCGWVAPLTLPARLLLQSLWMKKVKWDDHMDTNQLAEWHECTESLKAITEVTLPRYDRAETSDSNHTELHCFVDASKVCYSAAVYLRVARKNGFSTQLLISRSRLTPVRHRESATIPKLELLAVLIGSRLLTYTEKTLGIHVADRFLWCDSQIVLSWLRSERLLPPFVARRVSEINKSTNVHFRYVTSQLNPADVATRPVSDHAIPQYWFRGPQFLHRPSSEWPSEPDKEVNETELLTAGILPETEVQTATLSINQSSDPCPELPENFYPLPLDIVRRIQHSYFPNEVTGKTTPKTKPLGLFLDPDRILRCYGRYRNASLTFSQKHPILLPNNSVATTKIIQYIHETNCHVGISHTLSLLRELYWVPKGRSTVTRVLRKCAICVKYGGGPYPLPPMAPLPTERTEYNKPFTHVGLDYLGPLTVSENGVQVKRWCCLFTCMSVRAIHLELINNLTGEEFMLGLRRFIATRGTPTLIVSDNATNFKLAATIISSTSLTNQHITWRFIPELSPWQGGFYERLIGLVKHCLRRTLDTALLTDSQLHTTLKEIEAVLNTRPLTTVGSDQEMVLTPAHFLISNISQVLLQPPLLSPPGAPTTQQRLIEGWKRTVALCGEFEKMFKAQYLLSLREKHRLSHAQPRVVSHREPRIGDIVQVKGETTNRARWKVGKITGLLKSNDGLIRTAQVQLFTGGVLNRSIGHLYPLETDEIDAQPSTATPIQDSAPPQNVLPPHLAQTQCDGRQTPTTGPADTPIPLPQTTTTDPRDSTHSQDGLSAGRPSRLAARRARDNIRQWTRNLFVAAIHSVSHKLNAEH